VFFFRTFKRFQGGHLKVWDYYNHVLSSDFVPYIHFAADSVWDETNPWTALALPETDDPPDPDILFLGGSDWRYVPDKQRDDSPVPLINLIQHVRHADPGHELSGFLRHRAIRICVSQEVADVVAASGLARGPIVAIPNGIDIQALDRVSRDRTMDLLVVANKQPDLGRELVQHLHDPASTIRLIDEMLPRDAFLDALREARVTVFLPNPTEGFYLPALEGMAIGTVVVCPDVVGNRSFCVPGVTAFRPDYAIADILDATRSALRLSAEATAAMLEAARGVALTHDLSIERKRFLEVLGSAREIWDSGA
jgi:glycosyltransferase involved in cell wall biosynthesis